MAQLAPARLTGIYVYRPSGKELARDPGLRAYAYAGVVVGKSDLVREIRLGEDDLLKVISEATAALVALRNKP